MYVNISYVDWFSKYTFLSECRYVKSNVESLKCPSQILYVLCSTTNDVIVDKHNNILCFEDSYHFKKIVPLKDYSIQIVYEYHLFTLIDKRHDIGAIIKKIGTS